MKIGVRRITTIAIFLALAIVVSIAESFIPSFFVPGIKLGLANIIILLMLYRFKWWEAFMVDILRVVIAGLLRGTIFQMGFLMSASGALLSFAVMLIGVKLLSKVFTEFGISALGALFHCVGQIIVAVFYLENPAILGYLPIMTLFSMATGVFNAFVVKRILDVKVIDKIANMQEI